MPKLSVALVLLASLGLAACAGRAWERVRQEDTAAAYGQFLREHPGSRHAEEARQRSALVRLRARPTPKGYEAFQKKFPDSSLMPEARAAVEEPFFLRARSAGTLEAYQEFLDEFGEGAFATRARGNMAYLEARGFGGRPAELAAFAAEHPESDFAAEARRSASAVAVRSESAFRQVGLLLEMAPGTPGADRLVRVFTERAQQAYQEAGLQLVALSGPDDPRAAGIPVHLRIQHREEEVRTRLEATQVTSPGIHATTRVELARRGESQPIWSEEFVFHTFTAARREGTSILFGAGTQPYWSSFFVPVTHWSSQVAVRPPHVLGKPVAAVRATRSHAIALFEDGDFQVFEVGEPEAPLLVSEYRRPRDLARFDDLRIVGSQVVVFGEDGLEVVKLDAGGPKRIAAFSRGDVGSIDAVASLGGSLVTAGKRGIALLADGAEPEWLLQRQVPGLERLGRRLVFTDGVSLYVSTVPLLRQGRVEGELRLGAGFGPERVRVQGRTAVVLGKRGVIRVDLTHPGSPRLLSRIEMAEVGRIDDAAMVRGRLFLLGQRGLQLADAKGERVADAASVAAHTRLDATGRHLVMVGEQSLQLVDTTPFVTGGAASPGY